MKRTSRTSLALAALALPPLAVAQTPDASLDMASTLGRLIEPSQSDATPQQSADEIARAVQRLLQQGGSASKRIGIFGAEGAKALEQIIDKSSLAELTSHSNHNPIVILRENFPNDALARFEKIEAESPATYDMLVRAGIVPNGMIVTDDLTSRYADLVGRTIQRDTIDRGLRVDIALRALQDGVDSAAVRALLADELGTALRKMDSRGRLLRPIALEKYHDRLHEAPSQVASYILKYDPTLAQLMALSKSADDGIRMLVADRTKDQLENGMLTEAQAKSVLMPLLNDPEPDVQSEACEQIAEAANEDLISMASAELDAYVQSLTGTRAPSRDAVSSSIELLHRSMGTAGPSERQRMVERLRALIDGPHVLTSELFLTYFVRQTLSRTTVLAALEVALDSERLSIEQVMQLYWRANPREDEDEAEFGLDALLTCGDRLDTAVNFAQINFAQLPVERVPEALAWVGHADSRFDKTAGRIVWLRDGIDEPCRRSALDVSRPWRERVVGALGLIGSGKMRDTDVEPIRDLFVASMRDPERRSALTKLKQETYLRNGVLPVFHHVVRALYEDDAIASEHLQEFDLEVPAWNDEQAVVVAAVMDLAVARDARDGVDDAVRRNMEYAIATSSNPSVTVDVLEGHEDAVLAWAGPGRDVSSYVMRFAPERIPELVELTVARLASETDWVWQDAIDTVLRLPYDDGIPRLIQGVQVLGKPEAISYVEKRVGEIVRLREIEGQWRTGGIAAKTRQQTAAQVMQLLESSNEDVRVEAIRGLATLGSVESIPKLITLVGTGSAREVAAAKETLEFLRRQAALDLERAEAAASGN